MSVKFSTIAFDADDTLWENEAVFRLTQTRFADLLSAYTEPDLLAERLLDAERRNLGRYGFGVKGFVLSMIETAIEVTDERVPASVIKHLIDAGQDMLEHPIDLLDHVHETISALAQTHDLLLITKGDLLDQERKLAQSGLGDCFKAVEIVSHKDMQTYAQIFTRHSIAPSQLMMVGNSMKSDVLPALQTGAWGTYIPHNFTWELERAEAPKCEPRYHACTSMAELCPLISKLEAQ
jgi:putative hydrolase of the HAD superfamily